MLTRNDGVSCSWNNVDIIRPSPYILFKLSRQYTYAKTRASKTYNDLELCERLVILDMEDCNGAVAGIANKQPVFPQVDAIGIREIPPDALATDFLSVPSVPASKIE